MKVQNELEATIFHTPSVATNGANVSQGGIAGAPTDHASVTGVAMSLAAHPLKDAPPEVSEERISALKAAILAGTLRIQPQSLAKCLVDQELGDG